MPDRKAEELKEIFDWAVAQDMPHKIRMSKFQSMYENRINEDEWPTESQIPIPTLFTMTEELLASSYNYLFPNSNMIKLTPMSANVGMDVVSRVERMLYNQIVHKMDMKSKGLKTLRDCYKLGIGYGIVEPYVFTPAGVAVTEISSKDGVISVPTMAPGSRQVGIRYKYVSPSRVIPTPDGVSTNGDDRCSWIFYVEFYSESQFRRLVDDNNLSVNVNEVVQEARDNGYNYMNIPVNIIAHIAGANIEGYRNGRSDERIPVRIPVIKCYGENEHVWLANGTKVIFELKDTFETLRCPIMKATSSPDGDAYYPMGVAEATLSLSMGMNIWLNAMFDLMSHHIKPTLVYDKASIGSMPPERGPGGDIGAQGKVNDAATYLELPQIPSQLFALNDTVERYYHSGTGKNALMREPSAGMVRGGPSAFESLLSATGAREKLNAAILESGWFKPSIEQVLFQMQINAEAGDEIVSHYREYSREDRSDVVRVMSVTHEDLMNVYEVGIDLSSKFSSSAIDQNMALQKFMASKDSQYYDQYEIHKRLWGDDEEVQARVMLPREEVERKQREREQAELEAARAQGPAPSGGVPAAQGAFGQGAGVSEPIAPQGV